jgi:outer membrane protein TolC
VRASTKAAALATLAAVLLGAPAPPAGAEDPATCALAACIDQALSRHPVLAGMQARVEEARAAAGVARAEALPTFNVDGGTGYISGEAITPFGALGGPRIVDGKVVPPLEGGLYDATFVLLVPLLREGRMLGQTPLAEREGRLGIAEQEMSRAALRREVAASVAEAWFTALKLRRAEPLLAGVVTAREAIREGAHAREEQRLISHAAALAASVDLAAARHDLETTRIARERAERALGAATGVIGTALAPEDAGSALDSGAAPALPAASAGSPAAAPTMAAPEIRAAELRVEQKAQEIARIQKQWWPTASVRAHYGVADAFAQDQPINKQYYVGLRLTVPVFDSGLTSKRVAMARAQMEHEESALASLRLARAAELEDLRARVRQLDADLELQTAQIELARETVRAIRAKQAERLAAPGEEEEAQVALLRLELAASAARHDRALAQPRLRIATGDWEFPESAPDRAP